MKKRETGEYDDRFLTFTNVYPYGIVYGILYWETITFHYYYYYYYYYYDAPKCCRCMQAIADRRATRPVPKVRTARIALTSVSATTAPSVRRNPACVCVRPGGEDSSAIRRARSRITGKTVKTNATVTMTRPAVP